MNSWLLAAILFLSSSLLSYGGVRKWTPVDAEEFEGEFVNLVEGQVAMIRRVDSGKIFQILISDLSEEDRQVIGGVVDLSKSSKETREKKKPSDAELLRELFEKTRSQRRQRRFFPGTEKIPENFLDEWPEVVSTDLKPEIIELGFDEELHRYTYQSPHYEFISDVKLSRSLISKLSVLFEATRDYCFELPLSLKKAHLPGQEHRFQVFLFEKYETYVREGAPQGSAGVYFSGKDIVLVPLQSAGVKKVASSYTFDYKGSNKTLAHELTHQLTERCYYVSGARGWFSEGLAEYVAVTPYRSGKYNTRSDRNAVRDYAMEYGRDGRGGRGLSRVGDEIEVGDLQTFMLQSYSSFTANGNFNYGVGLLLTYYFLKMDREGDRGAINAFLKACREGTEGQKLIDTLLQGRSWDELEADIARGWRSRGVRLVF